MTKPLVVVSYGGGVNSTALLIELANRNEPPDLILFADTGGEFEETYAYADMFSRWCERHLGVGITKIRNATSPHASLEAECLANGTLPSLAFGFKGCSAKWKRQPLDRYVKKTWQPGVGAVARGEKIVRLLGIDAGEAHRSADMDDKWFDFRRPLVEWGIGRAGCLELIEGAGLCSPGKSACWYCPAMKRHEIHRLAERTPDLADRAIAMEHNARDAGGLKQIKGLGRAWSWEDLIRADRSQLRMFPEMIEEPCGCHDGEED